LKLILIRHGETRWNKERRVQGGDSDIELNVTGLNQARRIASFLENEDIGVIISSPLQRAIATANAIASLHDLPIEIDDRLKELNVGEFEGLALANLTTTFSQFLLQWGKGAQSARLPGGETLQELQQRSWEAVGPFLAEHKDGAVVVVSHYFVTLSLILKALDLPLDYFTKFKLDLGGMSIIEIEDRGTRLEVFNDTSY